MPKITMDNFRSAQMALAMHYCFWPNQILQMIISEASLAAFARRVMMDIFTVRRSKIIPSCLKTYAPVFTFKA